jgi:hypothetical protein
LTRKARQVQTVGPDRKSQNPNECRKRIPQGGKFMPNITGSFSGRTTVQSTVSLQDNANHDLSVLEVRGTQKSPDENWNNSKITYWGTTDLVNGNGPQRGYFVNEHADGSRDFGTFEGRVSAQQATMEGTWKFTGGTGKYQGLTGGGSYKGRFTSAVEVDNNWDGTYQLAAKTQAA